MYIDTFACLSVCLSNFLGKASKWMAHIDKFFTVILIVNKIAIMIRNNFTPVFYICPILPNFVKYLCSLHLSI